MSIDRDILYRKIENTLHRFRNNVNFDLDLVLFLIRKVVFHDPIKNCTIKGRKDNWKGLPETKSLFFAERNKGFPIGNLTSQLFGNVYLNDFDHFIKYGLGCRHYGRYVDDVVILHQNIEYLKSIIPLAKQYLRNELSLKLHPKKIYLQHFSKGVPFLGTVIKPYRIYIRNRIKGNFYQKIQYWNDFLGERQARFGKKETSIFLSGMNSYLGMMKHYNTYKLRKKMLIQNLSTHLWDYFYISKDYNKLILRN